MTQNRHFVFRALRSVPVLVLGTAVVMVAHAGLAHEKREAPFSPVGGFASSRFARVLDSVVSLGVPGIQAHITAGGREWTAAAGLSSVELRTPMRTEHRMRVASVTKMMTYAAITELARRGRLAVTQRAVEVLPPGALSGVPYAQEITIAHLLDHTSGLHNYNGENGRAFFRALFEDSARDSRRWLPEDIIAFARDPRHPPTGRPGERRAYSSTGYSVLELILTTGEETSLGKLYRDLVFEPLGMRTAGVEGEDLSAGDIVDSYARPSPADTMNPSPFGSRAAIRGDGLVNLSWGLKHYNAWAGAGGAVAASVEDLAAFMRGVRAGRVTVLRAQHREFATVRSRPDAFLSWSGGSWGIQSSILYEPGREITVIVLTNATGVGIGSHDVARRLLELARRIGRG